MRNSNRWKIKGTFTTTAPMHVGSGAITENSKLFNDKNKITCEVQAVTRDYISKPCIPATAIKGVLRAWAEKHLSEQSDLALVDRIFGARNIRAKESESGWAEFSTASFITVGNYTYESTVPYWDSEKSTGILSHVAIDRKAGTAAPNKLFFEEYVPKGVIFQTIIDATRLSQNEIALLLGILETGAISDQPYQFGANGADGWGRVKWDCVSVLESDATVSPTRSSVSTRALNLKPSTIQSFNLTLNFEGPFLVNDTYRAKEPHLDDSRTNFNPLKTPEGHVWLPVSSFRGALRSRAEFLLRSLDEKAVNLIEPLFGETKRQSRLTIAEFAQVGECAIRRQDFVAIDRFTGGAADGAKFDASYADRLKIRTQLVLDLDGLSREQFVPFALALRDVCAGQVTFGFGGAKGYGQAIGTLDESAQQWLDSVLMSLRIDTTTLQRSSEHPLSQDVLQVEKDKNGKFKRYLQSIRSAGKGPPKTAPWAELSKDLQESDQASSFDVEYELDRGEPVRIRLKGKSFVPPPTKTAAAVQVTCSVEVRPDVFANPYFFLRMSDRAGFTGELGDGKQASHDRYQPDRFSGILKVTLRTVTPLLICDDSRAELNQDGHKTYPVLMDGDKPLLASSSVRGMLRAAYEGVTNSRFGVFPFDAEERTGNARRMGYRMNAGEGLSLVPIRMESGQARLMFGTNPNVPSFDHRRGRWTVPGSLLHAAWVRSYRLDGGPAERAVRVDRALLPPVHGQPSWCWLEQIRRGPFQFWAVRQASATQSGLSAAPPPTIPSVGQYESLGNTMMAYGYFAVTNQNIKGKHDERFFFGPHAQLTVVSDAVKSKYTELVRDYQIIHEDEVETRIKNGPRPEHYLGHEPGKTAFSRHVYTPAAADLTDGTLCYAAARSAPGGFQIDALYPVTISRKLYDLSSHELLPKSLRPAIDANELSPADRVFGWVNQSATKDGEDAARRSLVRIGPVTCKTAEAVDKFPQPLT